ncbi:MAG TPA: sugar phosphorylase [Clostridia bacterium]|nr:sugar phosphorylase [Clostridia bacterium]
MVADIVKANKILGLLTTLYGDKSQEIYKDLIKLIGSWKSKAAHTAKKGWVRENDVMMITYGDSICGNSEAPLVTLKRFADRYLKDTITAVHILPMYPYTSDDGFSVVDYYRINDELGTWEDVKNLAEDYDMMYDAVVNHTSKSSDWFQGFLSGEGKYKDYFIEADPDDDYSKVIRPRTLPLLTCFDTKDGKKHVWTTFSDDQIDLNFKSPELLLEVLDVLLHYAYNGSRFIRLDAIGFAWKEKGTSCMHLMQTHAVVKLMRAVLDEVFPGTIIITETNVPQVDNISYFGNGSDEAQMVYQFPLPPLVFFSFITENAFKLSMWAKSLEETPLSVGTAYFNFLASHDGIGIRPIEGILTADERDLMLKTVVKHGGRVSFKSNSDGSKSPYELNINYMDALTDPNTVDNKKRADKFLAAQSILLSVAGVPGIYVHSLLGSQNWYEGVEKSDINRRINREKLNYGRLCKELEDSGDIRSIVFTGFSKLIRLRRQQSAFSPDASQKVLFLDERAFSFIRHNNSTDEKILVIINVSDHEYDIKHDCCGIDIVSREEISHGGIHMKPYQTRWIRC